jgi:ATP-dependent helicase/nuclease subunit B
MGIREQARQRRTDAWLAGGGTVLAATERTARAIVSAHHTARHYEGRAAWLTPLIFSWESWLRELWPERNKAGLMLMNALQEQALWSRAIGESAVGGSVLHPRRLAAAAQRAYRLLCDYAPGALRSVARSGWPGDAAIFSGWIEAFEGHCLREGLISVSRLGLELTPVLQAEFARSSPVIARSPLLLVGFDRLQETRRTLLDAWGEWEQDEAGEVTASARFLGAQDSTAEIDACVGWLRATFRADREARLLVITTGLQERRGELERALLEASAAGDEELDFEFSLGVPLDQLGIARSAILLLRWLHEPLSESELDWLLTSGYCVSSAREEIALAEAMRELRRRGRERPEWRLADFTLEQAVSGAEALPEWTAWTARMLNARDRLRKIPLRQSPAEWVDAAEKLLEAAGWPGFRPLGSVGFQAQKRWERVLEDCGSLGFDGAQMDWAEFVETAAEAVAATIFAAESSDARIQITEPFESAGQLADGIWFLGAHEENWPGRGQPHPLLPMGLQREAGMPHASPREDWKLAQEATERVLASAEEVIFSFAKQSAETENRPSRLVVQGLGKPAELSPRNTGKEIDREGNRDLTETFADDGLIPFPHGEIGGGAATLTRQSLCPFQAFATVRLQAGQWEPAETGLNAKQRGQLLHWVLHRVWGGEPAGGISSWEELQKKDDLGEFVRKAVKSVMRESFDARRRNSLPLRFAARYLELEEERLTQLVSEWLEFERERLPFTVSGTEVMRRVTVAGLALKVRLDRVDRLQNGNVLIVDYKSSDVGPKAWAGERPDDVQLPLYATFAAPEEDLEGLVFARVRPGEKTKFCGRVRDAAGTLQPGLSARNGLVKDPLTELQLEDWRERIERLGEDFLAGRAEVDPKEPGKTCDSCHLHAVCRIYESQPLAAGADDTEDSGDDGEEQENAGGGDA